MAVDFFYSVDVIKCFLDIGRIPIRMMNYLRCLLLAFFIAGRGYPPVAAVAAVGIAAGTGCSAKCCAGN